MQKGIYEEDGWIAEVEIVEHDTDEKGEGFVLKVLQTIQRPYRYINPDKTPKQGTTFDVWRAHGAGAYAGWTLNGEM